MTLEISEWNFRDVLVFWKIKNFSKILKITSFPCVKKKIIFINLSPIVTSEAGDNRPVGRKSKIFTFYPGFINQKCSTFSMALRATILEH